MAGPTPAELNYALKVAWRIPGMYRRAEGAFLYRLARRRGNLVELGCWMGRTTAILQQAAAVWGASVTTVDNFTTTQPGVPTPATPEKWRGYLKGAGIAPPELLAMPSAEAAPLYDREISLLFIDADHSYEAVKKDLEDWGPKVKVGGYVAIHDMFYPSVAGVCQAVVEWWLRERWQVLGQHDFTVAFRRTK